MVVDDLDDHVNMLYRAWPERIYVINLKGEIAYKGGIGPWGFDPKAAMKVATGLLQDPGKPAEIVPVFPADRGGRK